MYEVLYGDGPEAIMTKARGNKMKGENPKFRWYHLPANNIEWVEALVTRIFAENGSGKVLDEELKSNLGLNSSIFTLRDFWRIPKHVSDSTSCEISCSATTKIPS
ncbi:hypothetical protein M7I_4862 [Glarea lozoyensis 74030]|uniref:Uncharacterized protein n=1 Tax=Glarea lozoyensis (strain ATCC 74030 / MF5533) TaxID=1104152 RepID=H0EQB4_GLAL7|nr:hypothetical protein M7I_4862 [Glarea lozoyensis 74030]